MQKKIKIWFYSGSSAAIKEFSIPKFLVGVVLLFMAAFLGGMIYAGQDYWQMKTASFDNELLNRKISRQKNEIKAQRKQLQSFARKIGSLQETVDSLCIFEDKVRLIADIKQTSDTNGLIGIGGLSKNRPDYDIPLEEDHDSLIRELHDQVHETQVVTRNQFKDFESLIDQLNKKKNILAATPSIKPVDGWITSNFGYRTSPFTGQKEFHSGLDIANRHGEKILATANGKVSYAGRKMLLGKLVVIDHGHGTITRYGHLDKMLVKRGQSVKRGDPIGLMGNTGRSTGPHVHYEIKRNGTPVNPAKYILN
ncbi:MAG: M23 family metallopeptidase [Desulfobacteraceae bacterium]